MEEIFVDRFQLAVGVVVKQPVLTCVNSFASRQATCQQELVMEAHLAAVASALGDSDGSIASV